MKALVVYYSRTGNTKKVGDSIAKEIGADVEEVMDVKSRSGPLGWLRSGREASSKMMADIQPVKKDPSQYDLVILGTPNWASNMSSPMRTYLANNKDKLKKVAFFCTEGGRGDDALFKSIAEVTGKKPEETLVVLAKEVSQGNYTDKVKKFSSSFK